VGNVAERGPLAIVSVWGHSPTFRKMLTNESASECGFLYTKTRNHRKQLKKIPKNAKKQQPNENQKSTECRNIS